jgi:hypothetical protein
MPWILQCSRNSNLSHGAYTPSESSCRRKRDLSTCKKADGVKVQQATYKELDFT